MSTVSLGDICEVTAGQSAPQDPSIFGVKGKPFIRAGSLEKLLNGGDEEDCELIPEENAIHQRLRLFPEDTILFAKSGMSAKLGRIYRLKKPSYVVSHLAAVIPGPKVCPSYLQRWFEKHPPSRLIPNEAYPSIRISEISQLRIDIPSLTKQKRIAAILDKADAIRHKRQQAIKLANNFLRATFLDMFGDPVTNPKEWQTVLFKELIISGPQNGLYRPAKDYGKGTPILRIDSFYDGQVYNLSSLKRVQIDAATIDIYKLSINDIVINRVNSKKYLGKSALIAELYETTVFESNMMRLSVDNKKVSAGYLIDLLQKNYIKKQILSKSRDAVNQSSINQQDVKSLEIRLPPISLQNKYVEVVKKYRKLILKLQGWEEESTKLLNSLTQCAFRGEL